TKKGITMRKILSALVFASLVAGMAPAQAVTSTLEGSINPSIITINCLFGANEEALDCKTAAIVSSAELAITSVTVALLKEVKELQPDALEYTLTGESTPALESLIEKIQDLGKGEGKELSFEQVIDAINAF